MPKSKAERWMTHQSGPFTSDSSGHGSRRNDPRHETRNSRIRRTGNGVEYGLKSPLNPTGDLPVALLPLFGIMGTVIGSFPWGWLGTGSAAGPQSCLGGSTSSPPGPDGELAHEWVRAGGFRELPRRGCGADSAKHQLVCAEGAERAERRGFGGAVFNKGQEGRTDVSLVTVGGSIDENLPVLGLSSRSVRSCRDRERGAARHHRHER